VAARRRRRRVKRQAVGWRRGEHVLPALLVAGVCRVEEVLDIEVPLGELPEQAEEWELAVTEMTADDEEIADYVTSLEARGDAEVDVNEALSKIDGDTLAAEFERYLRRRGR
jgi:hypothetical protein